MNFKIRKYIKNKLCVTDTNLFLFFYTLIMILSHIMKNSKKRLNLTKYYNNIFIKS